MKNLKSRLLGVFFVISISIYGQKSSTQRGLDGFKEYYPIHEKPEIGYLSNMTNRESILFDAKPNIYYSIYNNMRKVMESAIYKPSYALYLTFQPHLRMYQEDSKPVKTPSYRISIGGQVLIKTKNDNFAAFLFESGHYSNGQAGCAFDESLIDESSECEMVYSQITDDTNLSDILNRVNGNFSTNQTKLAGSFRFNYFQSDDAPYLAHQISTSYTLFHNNLLGFFDIGGYSAEDIRIYGRHRFSLGYEFMHNFLNKVRYTLSANSEYIVNPHPSVEPWRIELQGTIYPFNGEIGMFVKYIYGHDNYNYRFVDSGSQINLGFTWDWFAPFEIKRAQKLLESR